MLKKIFLFYTSIDYQYKKHIIYKLLTGVKNINPCIITDKMTLFYFKNDKRKTSVC